MNSHKMDYELKKQFEKESIEIPELIKQRIHFTLENLPEKNKTKSFISSASFKYVLGSIACLILAFVTIFPFISNSFRSGHNYTIPDDMTTIQNSLETFTTVMPKKWETVELGDDPNHIINMGPTDQSVHLTVSEGVYYITTGDEVARNILMEKYEASDSYQDFVDKMINHYSSRGMSIVEIDKVDDIPIFMEKIDHHITLMAYPVVDKKPFVIVLESSGLSTVEELKEKGYYQYFKQAIQLTHPN